MNYRVLLTDAARRHIEEASAWWAEHRSLAQALRWLEQIHARIATLALDPDRCPLAHESSQFPFELRQLLFGIGRRFTHRVLFRIVGETVEVLAVRHVARTDLEPDELG
jgi:plasmid stabilization system protein ParE